MARTDTLTNYLTDVATAIKNKKGSQTPIQASAFDTEIANLPSGGGGGPDWTQIGYSDSPSSLQIGFDYAKDIYDNWDSSTSSSYSEKYRMDYKLTYFPKVAFNTWTCQDMFQNCLALQYVDDINLPSDCRSMFSMCRALKSTGHLSLPTSGSSIQTRQMFGNCSSLESVNITGKVSYDAREMFNGCTNLKNITKFNLQPTYTGGHQNMFSGCNSLTDTSLDNILQMCAENTTISSNKTLNYMGINNTTIYPNSRIEALPHYQDFITAGWTTGN